MGAALSSSKDEFIPDSSPYTDESGRPAELGGERSAASARVDFTSLKIDGSDVETHNESWGCFLSPGRRFVCWETRPDVAPRCSSAEEGSSGLPTCSLPLSV